MKRNSFPITFAFMLILTTALTRAGDPSGPMSHTAQEQIAPVRVGPATDGSLGFPTADEGILAVYTAPVPACPNDVTADRVVGFADLLAVLSAWGGCAESCDADVTHDAFVDFSDLLSVLSSWGECP